jgi:hypothetical protein
MDDADERGLCYHHRAVIKVVARGGMGHITMHDLRATLGQAGSGGLGKMEAASDE